MKFTKDLFKAEKAHQTLLAVVFAIYIIFNVETPEFLQPFVNGIVGHVVIVLLALSVFVHTGPIAGVLGLVAAYFLIKRSGSGNFMADVESVKKFIPSESNKCSQLNALNQFPATLEEEVIKKMVPLVKYGASSKADYKPVLNPTNEAAPIDYNGVN